MAKLQMPGCIAAALQELKTLWPDRVIIIEVRSAEECTSMHLPGALLIPLFDNQTSYFPKNFIPITVCVKEEGIQLKLQKY